MQTKRSGQRLLPYLEITPCGVRSKAMENADGQVSLTSPQSGIADLVAASVFAYLETVLALRDAAKVQTEIARIRAFNAGLQALDYDLSNVEFAMDETFEFMQTLHDNIITGNNRESLLLDAFGNENLSNSIIYHFKLMTSSFMQLNPDIYSPFVDRPLGEYCRNVVEPQAQEIENASLQALATGVIGPAGFAFDVLYLDRSVGDQVTPHHMVGENLNLPLITLLYRPGHYDIIYKDIAPVQVNFQHRLPELNHNYTSEDFFAGVETASLISPDASLATGYALSSAPYMAPSYNRQWTTYPPAYGSSNASTPPTELSTVSEESVLPQLPPVSEDRIRFNPYTFQTDQNGPLTTPVFKK
ncbi:putative ubiquitin thiolesterase [Phaeomoniella chlamydospora]|uniref:Putative ubiquitin thiolesterase n=1 Tax=Phaeomoniella chlamydospora TaxID=158046 RepID=A0A0G2EPU7_PHACM|nr:putative ubiquitin thiolesterase [Phaeomoniella chlamydospora]